MDAYLQRLVSFGLYTTILIRQSSLSYIYIYIYIKRFLVVTSSPGELMDDQMLLYY